MICWLDARTWLTSAGDDLQGWTSYSRRANGRWRTAHALPYLRGIHAELGESTAECVAVHPELFSGLALIAAVTRKHFEDVALLKLTHRVVVSDTSGVHLEDEVVEFAFQSRRLPFMELTWPWLGPDYILTS
jgi:hypothetical protein